MKRTSVIKFLVTFLVCQVALAVTLDEAYENMEKLLQNSTKHAQQALLQLEDIAQSIRILAERTISMGEVVIDNEVDRMVKQLDDIIVSADHMALNITSCTSGKVGVIHELHSMAKLEMNVCANRLTQQATIAVNSGEIHINGILSSVNQLYRRLDLCKASDATCIETVNQEIAFEELDVPRRLQEELDIAGNKAEANRLLLSECAYRETEGVVRRAGTIVQDVINCFDVLVTGTTRAPMFEQM